jgi:hypothetical protein
LRDKRGKRACADIMLEQSEIVAIPSIRNLLYERAARTLAKTARNIFGVSTPVLVL